MFSSHGLQKVFRRRNHSRVYLWRTRLFMHSNMNFVNFLIFF